MTNPGYGANGAMVRPAAGPSWGAINSPPEIRAEAIRRHVVVPFGTRVIPYIALPEEQFPLLRSSV